MARIKRNQLQVNLNLNVRGLSPSATLVINELSNELIKHGKKVFKLGRGQSHYPLPDTVVEALKRHAHQKDYLPVKGLYELKESVANFNSRIQNITTSADDVLIGPGSKELIFILQLVYYGDIIIPTPSWVSYSPQARIVGRHVNWVNTDRLKNYRVSAELLDLLCRNDPERPRVVILNYPDNPTGCSYSKENLKKLAQVARKYKLIIVSDEIYGLLNHKGQHYSIAQFYPEGTIISSGLSKWCGAGGWRLGTFSFPPELKWLLNAMAIVASETYTATSSPIQHAAITAFNGNAEIDEYLVKSRKILKGIASYLVSKLKELKLDLPVPQGAFYLFPDFEHYREKLNNNGIYTSVELCSILLKETGIALLPGSDFGRQTDELTARLAYVDFDGRLTLSAIDSHLESFDNVHVVKYCPKLVEAVESLGDWLSGL